ncbi:MAG: hypothetical protein HKM05_10250 [Spirochaetales bacterium]|nr:hypothetical protein [Spirochaetales bacterium]
MNIQYLTDDKGHQTAVLIPINEWTKLTSEVSKLQKESLFVRDLHAAFKEVADFKTGKTKLSTFDELFND